MFQQLKNGLMAIFQTQSERQLIQALGEGPITLTDLVGRGCDAMECQRASNALLAALLVYRSPSERSQVLWGTAIDFASGFREGGGSKNGAQAAPRSPNQTQRTPKPAGRPSSADGAGDSAVEQALTNTLEKLVEAEHFYASLALLPDDSAKSIDERLSVLDNKYSDDKYTGFMLSADGLGKLERIQGFFQEARKCLLVREEREAYHAAKEISEDSLRVPLSAIMEAEQLSITSQERVDIDAHEEAVTLLEQAVELVPHDPHRITQLARLIFDSLREEKLEGEAYPTQVDTLIEKAIQLETASSVPYKAKAYIMETRGDATSAVEAYQRALALNSSDKESREGIRRLRTLLQNSDAEGSGEEGENVMSKLSGMLFKR